MPLGMPKALLELTAINTESPAALAVALKSMRLLEKVCTEKA